MQPTEAEIKAIEDRIRAQHLGKQAPSPAPKPVVDVPVDQQPKAYSIKSSIDISKVEQVSRPNVRDISGKIISPEGKISKPSGSAYSSVDAERIALERIKAEEEAAKKELTSEAILNKLAATERVVKKLQKEITELKKK